MKIIDKNTSGTRYFKELEEGDIFKNLKDNHVYMKTTTSYALGGTELNAVDLITGMVINLHENTIVVLQEAELTISNKEYKVIEV